MISRDSIAQQRYHPRTPALIGLLVLVFFFGAAVARERRGGLLSIAARKMRLMRV